MEIGAAELHGTALGLIFFGFSYQNLCFKSKDKKEIKELDNRSVLPSLRCSNSEILIVNKNSQSE